MLCCSQEVTSIKKVAQSSTEELKAKVKKGSILTQYNWNWDVHVPWHVQNAALQEQVQSLFEEVTRVKEDKLQLVEKVAQASRSLEVGKEEEQMLKLALAEKSSQLLQAEDRMLWVIW